MTEIKVNGSFVSEKIAKIRWIREQYSDVDSFVTGSWDFQKNHVRVWKLESNEYSDEDTEFIPKCKSKLLYANDISGLEFIDEDHIASSFTNGSVSIIHLDRSIDCDQLKEINLFEKLHKYESGNIASCSGISVYEKEIATVGEDGALNVLTPKSKSIVRTINDADSCALTSVCFINSREVLTGNRMGVMKMFDIHSNSQKASMTFLISCEDDKKPNGVTCLTYHPTQKHIIFGGSEEGSITVWDLRQPHFPASYLSAHKAAITEIAFHKTQPSKLFTASENGELWQWSQNTLLNAQLSQETDISLKLNIENGDNVIPWLNGDRAKNKINVSCLISGINRSVNSFDSINSRIICGCDNEAIYLIENMF